MSRRTRNLESLRRHQVTVERSLADVRAGRNVSHLTLEDVVQLEADLEKRQAAISIALAPFHGASPRADDGARN
jgi:hypothetical protein